MKSGNNPVKKHIAMCMWTSLSGMVVSPDIKKNSNVIHNVLNLNLLHVVHKKRISDLWFLSAMSNKKQRARAEKKVSELLRQSASAQASKGAYRRLSGLFLNVISVRLNSVISAINPFSITLPGSLPCNGLHSCMTLIWYMVWPPRL